VVRFASRTMAPHIALHEIGAPFEARDLAYHLPA
jgi:hypothetical protein